MIDALGAQKMSKELRELMIDAGCKVTRYHPIRLIDIGQLNKRTHRKLAIFDGSTGYIFGHGISRLWTGNGQDKDHWRDTGVRLRGPIVNAVQSVFAQHWIEETGEVLVGEKYFPHLEPAGDCGCTSSPGAPLGGVSDLELMFKMAIATAQKELIIQNPYFIARRRDGRAAHAGGQARCRGQDHGARRGHRQPDRQPRRPPPLRRHARRGGADLPATRGP